MLYWTSIKHPSTSIHVYKLWLCFALVGVHISILYIFKVVVARENKLWESHRTVFSVIFTPFRAYSIRWVVCECVSVHCNEMKNRKHQHENENWDIQTSKEKSTEWKGIKQQRAHFGRVLLLKAMKETMNHITECGVLPGESETKTRHSNERAKKTKAGLHFVESALPCWTRMQHSSRAQTPI